MDLYLLRHQFIMQTLLQQNALQQTPLQKYCLQYFSFTHPNISYAVNKVCQYMHCPRIPHWPAVKQILRYLCLISHFGLIFSVSSAFTLIAFLMLIGLGTLTIASPVVASVCTLVLTWYPGVPRNNQRLPDRPLKLNANQLQTPPMNCLAAILVW